MAVQGKQLAPDTITNREVDTSTGSLSTINAGDAEVSGSSDAIANKGHQHGIATAAPSQGLGAGNTEGSSSNLSRADHDHTIRESGGQDLTMGAVADGEALQRSGTAIIGVTASVGDVVGPASATDEAIARYDTTTGKLLQNSSPTINDTGEVNMQSQKITALLAGTVSTDAVNKQQLDDAITGLDTKQESRLATAATLTGWTASGSGVGKTLTSPTTATSNNDFDGVTAAVSDRILIKDGPTTVDNGIYTVTQLADGATLSTILTRSTDFDQDAEVTTGAYTFVIAGSTLANSGWLVQTANPITVDTTAITFVQFNGLAQVTAGTGLTKTGNTIDAVANADGSIVANANDLQVGVLATDAQHGARGGGSQHAIVVAAGAAGFQSGTDKSKLDGIEIGAQVNDTPRQERVTTQSVVNSDTALTDTLDFTPVSDASVLLLFNGVAAIQGAGEDYTISGTTITWLASSGTAPNMQTNDDLVAYYMS